MEVYVTSFSPVDPWAVSVPISTFSIYTPPRREALPKERGDDLSRGFNPSDPLGGRATCERIFLQFVAYKNAYVFP